MPRVLPAASMLFALLVLLAVSGCGSNSTPSAIDQVLEPRIDEYVGDGGGSLKPWPDFLGPLGHDSPSVVAPKLKYGDPPKTGKVARKQVSWYRLQAISRQDNGAEAIITLQPLAGDEDTDLFVLEGRANNFDDGADALVFSRRAPSASDTITGGGAPDWVCRTMLSSAGWPGGHVAVLGVNEVPAVKHFRIEMDPTLGVQANDPVRTASVARYDSVWYNFSGTAGTQYTVVLDDTGAGDPDVFIYGDGPTKFIGKDTSSGDASIPFTATETGAHYIRIYGYSANPNGYSIEVTSP